ncbi:hypothetical protein [Aliarcobacter butzleri]|uniref:hypothetical protein n=1 Tax=Aliarcobacter butzleri TaxID=28197 RepID=UPI0021B218C0|nr:hypothetical protein [Aliarcobacter butzleri]MCT7561326.1 hypothetical protein [Aliarcobacter butzleri]
MIIQDKKLSNYHIKLTIKRLQKLLNRYERDQKFGSKNPQIREENKKELEKQLAKYKKRN